jgi:TonB family protein
MNLAGDLAEFSLADLVQVAGVAGRICCIRVMAAEGNGALYLDGGEAVGATYENLVDFDAFVALVAARAGHFQVEDGAAPAHRRRLGGVQKLLLEANALVESGQVPRPRPRVLPHGATAVPGGSAGDGERRGPNLWIGGGAAALVLLGAVSWLAFARHDVAMRAGNGGAAQAAVAAAATEPAIEAARLTAPGDAVPVLAAGRPPVAPDPGAVLKPTIVCRLLVDATGRVADAKIYRSRLDLAVFEDVALDAARQYRFRPGRRAGKPVAVWINWPVSFR